MCFSMFLLVSAFFCIFGNFVNAFLRFSAFLYVFCVFARHYVFLDCFEQKVALHGENFSFFCLCFALAWSC